MESDFSYDHGDLYDGWIQCLELVGNFWSWVFHSILGFSSGVRVRSFATPNLVPLKTCAIVGIRFLSICLGGGLESEVFGEALGWCEVNDVNLERWYICLDYSDESIMFSVQARLNEEDCEWKFVQELCACNLPRNTASLCCRVWMGFWKKSAVGKEREQNT